MTEKLNLLDMALELSHLEMGYLESGDVERAEESAAERGELIRKALSSDEDIKADQFMEKLVQLKNIQGRLTDEAKRLHASLKEDLQRVRQESRRMNGYHKATQYTPLMRSRYSKLG